MINYISIIAIPFTIFFIVSYGYFKKIKVFDSFLIGCKDGIKTVIKIFPTLIALFLAIYLLRSSGILNFLTYLLSPIISILDIPTEVLPLMLIRPISGSAATAISVDIMKNFGVDTQIRHHHVNNSWSNRNNALCYFYLY